MRTSLSGIAVLLLAAALVLAVAGDSTAGKAVAITFFGVACVVAISLVFFAIGRAEDAERERSAAKPPPEDPHAGEAARRARPRPPRRPI